MLKASLAKEWARESPAGTHSETPILRTVFSHLAGTRERRLISRIVMALLLVLLLWLLLFFTSSRLEGGWEPLNMYGWREFLFCSRRTDTFYTEGESYRFKYFCLVKSQTLYFLPLHLPFYLLRPSP